MNSSHLNRGKDPKSMALRSNSGFSMAKSLNPDLDKPVRSKDYMKENLEKLRTIQSYVSLKKEIDERNAGVEVFKLDRFKNVESVVFQNVDFTPRERPASSVKPVLKSKIQRPETSGAYTSAKTKKLPPVPSAREQNVLAPRVPKNFKAENTKAVDSVKQVAPEPAQTRKADYGQVPQYLLERKLEMEKKKAEELQAEADKDIPPGMIRMSEPERLKTLELLSTNKEQVEDSIRRLPLRIETLSQKERQNALLVKLKEIEEAVKIFSRTPVFITP